MLKVTSIAAIVVGIAMTVAGVVTWVIVGNRLSDQMDRRLRRRRHSRGR